MQKFYVGIDVSKGWLDVAICSDDGGFNHDPMRFDNTEKGIAKAIKIINKQKGETRVCFEHTGIYGLQLTCLLEKAKIRFSVVSPIEIKRSIGLTRGKNDVIDAKRIALYAATNYRKLKPGKLPSQALLKIKQLLSYRKQLSTISRQLKCSLKNFEISLKSIDVSDILESINAKINDLKSDMMKLEKEIERIIKNNTQLAKNYELAMSVRGIGPVISANLLVYTSNFTAFDCPRKFNCYAGLAPFQHTSGSSIKGKATTSHLRNKTMKALLFNAATCASQYDKQLKGYYKRKTSEGKHRMVVLNAVAAKIIYRVFAVVKRQSPYVEFSQ